MITKKKLGTYFFLLFSLLVYLLLPEEIGEMAKRLLAIFTFAVLFWAFEVIDLYATSLSVVSLLSFFILGPSGQREYNVYFSSFASPVILLFFGGFVLAAAIRKHRLDEWLLFRILKFAGPRPRAILGAVLFSSGFLSFWISNTAAAAMVLALCAPLLGKLPRNDPLGKSLPLAVAFGCNIGGMGTPIGTPPNAIVLGILKEYGISVSFGEWMAMAVPLVLLLLLFIFLLLSCFFPSRLGRIPSFLKGNAPLTREAKMTAAVGSTMVILWLFGSSYGLAESWVALAGVCALGAFGLIKIEDLHSIDWHILLLMWGGLALGTGIENSQILSNHLSFFSGVPAFALIAGLSFLALFMSTFISNTATANLVLPFAVGVVSAEVSLAAIPVALCCSLAMSLPVSTPPNAIAYSWGTVRTKDMVGPGSAVGLCGFLLILAGFWWIIPWFI